MRRVRRVRRVSRVRRVVSVSTARWVKGGLLRTAHRLKALLCCGS